MKLTTLLVFLIFVIQNNSTAQTKVDYIIFGVYAGECNRNCDQMFKLSGDTLLTDTSNNYFDHFFHNKPYIFKGHPLFKAAYLNTKKIRDSIPSILLKSESTTFGQPDNRDQGGIFVQFMVNGKAKSFLIDTDSSTIPKELYRFVELIENVANAYRAN